MQVVLLAAGMGKRLAPYTETLPKCLLKVAEESLLERHLRTYQHAGIDHITIVTGHQSEMLRKAVLELPFARPIDWVFNPDYRHGSLLSLKSALGALRDDDLIFMDADVYYGPGLFMRLRDSSYPNCALVDTRSSETGEEMMIGVSKGRAIAIARRLDPSQSYDLIGESVGFFKVCRHDVPLLRTVIDDTEVGFGKDSEYEAAINRFFQVVHVGVERADDFSWTEIDFEEDLTRAREVIAPALEKEAACAD